MTFAIKKNFFCDDFGNFMLLLCYYSSVWCEFFKRERKPSNCLLMSMEFFYSRLLYLQDTRRRKIFPRNYLSTAMFFKPSSWLFWRGRHTCGVTGFSFKIFDLLRQPDYYGLPIAQQKYFKDQPDLFLEHLTPAALLNQKSWQSLKRCSVKIMAVIKAMQC